MRLVNNGIVNSASRKGGLFDVTIPPAVLVTMLIEVGVLYRVVYCVTYILRTLVKFIVV